MGICCWRRPASLISAHTLCDRFDTRLNKKNSARQKKTMNKERAADAIVDERIFVFNIFPNSVVDAQYCIFPALINVGQWIGPPGRCNDVHFPLRHYEARTNGMIIQQP